MTHPYITHLRQWSEERRARRAAEAMTKALDPRAELRAKVRAWWEELPSCARKPRYLLEELVPRFGCTPQQLGVALYELGWHRKRVWREDGPYRRYWMPE